MPARSIGSRIRATAIEILREHPEGLRYSDLQRRIHERDAMFKLNTIAGSIYNLGALSKRVEKPSRGLYRIVSDTAGPSTDGKPATLAPPEEAFYVPFADWLKNELEDATKAIPRGGGESLQGQVGNAGCHRQAGLEAE